ncbi:MAG: PepSY-like domain-containing protein [Bacteroidales bacterium]|nr:PepSY-like domain-containing protein [Bacteroidales bacterium]
MKLKLYFLTLLFAGFLLQSCDDDDDNVIAPTAVSTTFSSLYPSATVLEWEIEGSYYKAEFYNNTTLAEAWFTSDGTWVRTETDYIGTLPEAIQTYISTNYAGYYIEDQEYVETPTSTYYHIELENAADHDVYLNIYADGTLVGA